MPSPGIRKLYYSIREVGEMTGLKAHVLRYWETEFETLHPKKNRAGNRAYTEHDVEVVRQIQSLLRDQKYTIEGARLAIERDENALEADSGLGSSLASMPVEDLRDLRAFLSDVLRRL